MSLVVVVLMNDTDRQSGEEHRDLLGVSQMSTSISCTHAAAVAEHDENSTMTATRVLDGWWQLAGTIGGVGSESNEWLT